MPTTSSGFYYPDTGTTTSLETILAAAATSQQEVIDDLVLGKRQVQTFRWADSAARTAQTGMNIGDRGWQIDTGVEYQYTAAGWYGAPGSSFAYLQGSVTPGSGSAADIPSTNTKAVANNVTVGTNALIVAVDGWYQIDATISWASNNVGARVTEITLNGAAMTYPLGSRKTANGNTRHALSGKRYLVSGDVLRCNVLQDSGGALTATGTLSATFVGAAAGPV